MIIEGFNIRLATIHDIPFLVDTIIEAEKSSANILSWSTIFGLTEVEIRGYLSDMLSEEIDGCELSVSSFMVAEQNDQTVAALSAWAEAIDNKPSSSIKGDLLGFFLPKECIQKALKINALLHEVHIDYIAGSIQKGAGYVMKEFRNRHLFGILTKEIINNILKSHPDISQVYTQIYGSNIAAIKANEKVGFTIVKVKESADMEILKYLPSNKKLLMKKELFTT